MAMMCMPGNLGSVLSLLENHLKSGHTTKYATAGADSITGATNASAERTIWSELLVDPDNLAITDVIKVFRLLSYPMSLLHKQQVLPHSRQQKTLLTEMFIRKYNTFTHCFHDAILRLPAAVKKRRRNKH
eukprot:4469417-Pleurochrysis_carterae.AAC.1